MSQAYLHDLADFLRQTDQLERRQSENGMYRAAFELVINRLDRILTDEERIMLMTAFNCGVAYATFSLVPEKIQ